jgi:peptidoglycan/LPS O-acetylase OafA/YrhL
MKLIYRPEIDGLRAIAVSAVILYHAQIKILGYQSFKGGFIGVDIFFVISGYLITSIILKELVATGSFSFKNFYERRIRRILPALLAVMLVSLPLAWIFLLPGSLIDFSKSILYSLGFSSNFYFHFSGQIYGAENGFFKPFLHTWSLSIEEQYYILFPIILLVTFKYLKKYLIHILILGFIISLGLADWGSRNYPSLTFYVLPTRGWELLSGSILAYFEITKGHRSKHQILNLILPSIGLFLIGHSIFLFNDEIFHPSFYTLSPIIGVCLIIWFSNKNEFITKILSTKLFVGIGLISYSLYLWHYPIFAFDKITEFSEGEIISKILLFVMIIILSILSYFLIEKPARNKDRNYRIVFFNIFLIFIFLIVSNIAILNKIPKYFEENLGTNFGLKRPTADNCIKDKDDDLVCSLNFNKNKKKVYLIGDSHVRSISLDFKDKIIKKNYELNLVVENLCFLFREFDFVSKKTNKKKCKKYNLLDKIFLEENSIFVIGGRFPRHLNRSNFDNKEGGIEPGIFEEEYFSKGKYDNIENSFKSEIENLSKKNYVILIYPIPEVGWNFPQKLFNQLPKKFSLDKNYYITENYITTSYEVYKDRTKSSFELLDSIQGDSIFRVYPHKLFCDTILKDRCVTHDDQNIFYADNNHPSLKGSQMINDLIIKQIKNIELKSN